LNVKNKTERLKRLWFFKVYAEELCRLRQPDLDPERLIRFYMEDALNADIEIDFKEWLKKHRYKFV